VPAFYRLSVRAAHNMYFYRDGLRAAACFRPEDKVLSRNDMSRRRQRRASQCRYCAWYRDRYAFAGCM